MNQNDPIARVTPTGLEPVTDTEYQHLTARILKQRAEIERLEDAYHRLFESNMKHIERIAELDSALREFLNLIDVNMLTYNPDCKEFVGQATRNAHKAIDTE